MVFIQVNKTREKQLESALRDALGFVATLEEEAETWTCGESRESAMHGETWFDREDEIKEFKNNHKEIITSIGA